MTGPSVTFRPGRLSNDPSRPRLKLGHFLTSDRPGFYVPPAQVDWDAKVSGWGVLGNDDWGDCALAAQAHALQAWTANAGTEIVPNETDTLVAYGEVTGFDIHAGPPGSNPTDRGTVMQDGLDYWRRIGMPVTTSAGVERHKILAFAEVDHRNVVELETAVALFGEVLFGVKITDVAMEEFNSGAPWGSTGGVVEGGHAICSARYDRGTARWRVITWGREQEVTQRWLDRWLDEAWVPVSSEWIAANGSTPSGLDLAAMGREFVRLTGEPAPWGSDDPPPEPPPRADALVVAAQTLAADQGVLGWLRLRHSGTPKHVARMVQAVVDAAERAS